MRIVIQYVGGLHLQMFKHNNNNIAILLYYSKDDTIPTWISTHALGIN